MSKDTKIALWIVALIIILTNPLLLILGIIIYFIYSNNKNKYVIKPKATRTENKINDYEVINTTAEVIDSKVIQQDEWKATKEYKH